MTDPFSIGFISNGGGSVSVDRYIIGPTVEAHLPRNLSIEVDALWRRSGFYATGSTLLPGPLGGSFIGRFTISPSVSDWQVPLLAKWAPKFVPVHPFVDGGVVYRHVSADSSDAKPTHPNTTGISVGGGVALKVLRLRVSPEIRYTRWPTAAYDANSAFVQGNRDQADLLVGFTF